MVWRPEPEKDYYECEIGSLHGSQLFGFAMGGLCEERKAEEEG